MVKAENMVQKLVYCLTKNNVPFYVGITSNPESRLLWHKRKYGKDIELIEIENNADFETERLWVQSFQLMGANLLNKSLVAGKCASVSRSDTEKVVVTLMKEKSAELRRQAEMEGVPYPTYCRMLLSRMAGKQDE